MLLSIGISMPADYLSGSSKARGKSAPLESCTPVHPQGMPRHRASHSWRGTGIRQDFHEQEVASLGEAFRLSTAPVHQQLLQEPGWCPHAVRHCCDTAWMHELRVLSCTDGPSDKFRASMCSPTHPTREWQKRHGIYVSSPSWRTKPRCQTQLTEYLQQTL